MKKLLVLVLVAAMVMVGTISPIRTKAQDEVTLTLGSWRVDDVKPMEEMLAAFHEEYPNITVKFDPTNPPDYNATLQSQFETGTAPDVMYVRSFATGRGLFDQGFLADITDLPGLQENFDPAMLGPWSTEDGKAYAVPFIAVSHGIYYNIDLFNELGIAVPTTWEELIAAAKTLKDNGYDGFANASGDAWTIAEIVFMNLAPNFIGGREGRLEYQTGKRCFNDENVVAAFQAVADMGSYVPEDNAALTYYDSQQIFLQGEAGMWMGGSWDIPVFEAEAPDFEWGVFATPAPAGAENQYITFHLDAAVGMNAKTAHPEEAKTFLSWLTGPNAAQLLGDLLPGFFPIQKEAPALSDPHAAEFLSLNEGRGQDWRWAWELLGAPSEMTGLDGYTLMQDNAIAVLNGKETPQEAADTLQNGLAQWFEPAKSCGM